MWYRLSAWRWFTVSSFTLPNHSVRWVLLCSLFTEEGTEVQRSWRLLRVPKARVREPGRPQVRRLAALRRSRSGHQSVSVGLAAASSLPELRPRARIGGSRVARSRSVSTPFGGTARGRTAWRCPSGSVRKGRATSPAPRAAALGQLLPPVLRPGPPSPPRPRVPNRPGPRPHFPLQGGRRSCPRPGARSERAAAGAGAERRHVTACGRPAPGVAQVGGGGGGWGQPVAGTPSRGQRSLRGRAESRLLSSP